MGYKTGDVVEEEGGMGTVRETTHGEEDDGGIPVIQPQFREVSVDEPEGEGDDDTKEETEGNPLISRSDAVHFTC